MLLRALPTGGRVQTRPQIYLLGFQLTHSALSYQLSEKRWQRPAPQRDPADCVTPDLMIPTPRRHIIEGIDPVLEYLRKAR